MFVILLQESELAPPPKKSKKGGSSRSSTAPAAASVNISAPSTPQTPATPAVNATPALPSSVPALIDTPPTNALADGASASGDLPLSGYTPSTVSVTSHAHFKQGCRWPTLQRYTIVRIFQVVPLVKFRLSEFSRTDSRGKRKPT